MIHYPKISIVTPSYNQGKFIEQTIKSILDQDYPNLEYIIIDGGSTDETIEIIKKYEDKLTYWISESDNGQSHAINKGLFKCTGDIFNWVNSDDYLEPGALFEIAQNYIDTNFNALCGKVNVIDVDKFSHVRNQSFIGLSIEDTIVNFNINQEGTWWNMNKIIELKGVNESFKYLMDLDLWFRLILKYDILKIVKSDKILSNFRRHEEAKSTINKQLGDFQNSFFFEELVIFNEFVKPKHSLLNCFLVKELNYNIDVRFELSEELKIKISEEYIFKLIKKSFYLNNYVVLKKMIKFYEALNYSKFRVDINYFKRKVKLKKILFWR